MPSRIPSLTLRDFTGGLNLRADGFDIHTNESPDMLNVVLDSRGGFQARPGCKLYYSALATGITGMTTFETTSGFRQLIVSAGSDCYYANSGTFSWTACGMGLTLPTPTRCGFVQAQDKLYVFRTNNGTVRRWNGAASVTCGTAFNDTGTPANNGVPAARYGAWHQGRLWVAYTTETAVDYPHRVRFSYTSNVANTMGPEDFRTADYIDIAPGGDTGAIVALVPFQDRLFVFKEKGIYAILGNSSTNFQVVTLSEEYGACGPDAVVASSSGIFFFDWPTGLHAISVDGSSRYLFENLLPLIESGYIQTTSRSTIALGYNARKVWVSVPYGNSAVFNTRTYILDTAIGGGARYGIRTPISEGRTVGAWTAYDFGITRFVQWNAQNNEWHWLGADASTTGNRNRYVLTLDGSVGTKVYAYDTFGNGQSVYTSYYKTGWLDMGEPAALKRWKRPYVTVMDDTSGTLAAVTPSWYKNYDGATATGGAAIDQSSITGYSEVLQSPSAIGTARSIQFKLSSSGAFWGCQGITFPYVMRSMRAVTG